MNPQEQKDVCDKHGKEDCMDCFYTTQPIDPTPTSKYRILKQFGEDSNPWKPGMVALFADESVEGLLRVGYVEKIMDESQEQMKKAFIERYIKPEDAHNAGVSLEGILSQAIQTEREGLREKVEGMKYPSRKSVDELGRPLEPTEAFELRHERGYNKALDEVLSLFSSKEESHG